MKTLGVDFKGSDVILVMIEDGEFRSVNKISIVDDSTQKDMRGFYVSIIEFAEWNGPDEIVIIDRARKGKYAGGVTSFKLEAVIQVALSNVRIIHGATVRAFVAKNPSDKEIYSYAMKAFNVARCGYHQKKNQLSLEF